MSQIYTSEQPDCQKIGLEQLNLAQLSQLKQQLDKELMVIQETVRTLKIDQSKYNESIESLDKITPNVKEKEILVPLSGSMYVPGKLADVEKVLIDIGTGYFAEKSISEAKEYFKRLTEYATQRIETVQAMGIEKNKIRNAALIFIEMKIKRELETQ